jgi:flavin reductase (DIM6/NTAB) family NADH-FMN oxidoreductase RutF
VGVPLIAECPVALECRVTHHLTLGAHDLFVGEVLAVQADEEILTPQGHLDHEQASPLAYAGGHYFHLGAQVGRFGDWR